MARSPWLGVKFAYRLHPFAVDAIICMMTSEAGRRDFVFAGRECIFSVVTLMRLIASGHAPRAVLIATPGVDGVRQVESPGRVLPTLSGGLAAIAAEAAVPAWHVGDVHAPAFEQWLTAQDANLVIMACFPQIIPAGPLSLPRHGWWNLHPSLLPWYRGPEPIFWAFAGPSRPWGVTLHQVDAGIDTGPILRAVETNAAEGLLVLDYQSLERETAFQGAELIRKQLEGGWGRRGRPQPKLRAVLPGRFPRPAELTIDPAKRSVDAVQRFAHGLRGWPGGVSLQVNGFPRRVDPNVDNNAWHPNFGGPAEPGFELVHCRDGAIEVAFLG